MSFFDQPVAVAFVERRLLRQHFVQRQPQRIEVAAMVGLAGKRFRRHVPQCAQNIAGMRDVLLVVGLGESEVGNQDDAAQVEHQVAGFDVSMLDPLVVGVLQRRGDLHPIVATLCHRRRRVRRRRFAADDGGVVLRRQPFDHHQGRNTSSISSARCGCCFLYSSSGGRSSLRYRSTNSSASSSTISEFDVYSAISISLRGTLCIVQIAVSFRRTPEIQRVLSAAV